MLEIPKSPSTTTASSGSRTPDERLTRYRIWLASFSTSYPSGVRPPAGARVARLRRELF